jgi:hypothetical protein
MPVFCVFALCGHSRSFLLAQEKPYADMEGKMGPLELMQKVATGFRPTVRSDCPQHFVSLSCLCWATEPEKRLTAPQAIEVLQSSGTPGGVEFF